jgi:hypothetical protein
MISRPSFSPLLLALTFLLTCATPTLAIPSRNKIINRLSRAGEPVAIVSAKVNGKAIDFGKVFAGRNNWLGGLTFVIKNSSAKTVSWARVALSFTKPTPGGELSDYLTYGIGRWDIDKIRGGGPPLKPGETAEVSYSWEQYQSVREILDGMDYPSNITKIRVSVDQVIFADQPELMWIEGKMNEFHSPTGWRPITP